MQQHVTEPTRFNETIRRGNILDLILTSYQNMISNCKVNTGINDHELVTFTLHSRPSIAKPSKRKIYQYKRADWNLLRSDMSHMPLDIVINEEDVDESWTNWKTFFMAVIDQNIPHKYSKDN